MADDRVAGPADVIADLGDGLVLRRTRAGDVEALAAFNAEIHREPGGALDQGVAALTRDLLARPHPTVDLTCGTVVEDASTGAIVSSLVLIPQTWSSCGIPFGVGQVELVGTDPAYRRRGLVRRQMEAVHRWSAERGDLVQAIAGIPHYYRQFGYEYALDLDGARGGTRRDVPPLAAGAVEPFHLRPATEADAAFLASVDRARSDRPIVTVLRTAGQWRYEVAGHDRESVLAVDVAVVETRDGTPTGYVVTAPRLHQSMLDVRAYELLPGVSWRDATPSVLRSLDALGEALAGADGAGRFEGIWFQCGISHPAYDAVSSRFPLSRRPYAWYLRVADLPAYLRRIAPVLEERLARSDAAGFSGTLRITFFRDGVTIGIDAGTITSVEPWERPDRLHAAATFPDLTFLQLLFGYRSLEALEAAFPDCRARTDDGRFLLPILFPPVPSRIWAFG